MGCVLALDVGTRTIGVARAERTLAAPLTTVQRRGVQKDVAVLADLCRQQGAVAVVVGLPLEKDGAEGRAVRLARQVGAALAEQTGLPIHYQDERYSTVEARWRLSERGLSERQQRAIIDQAAAAVILQEWLDGGGATT